MSVQNIYLSYCSHNACIDVFILIQGEFCVWVGWGFLLDFFVFLTAKLFSKWHNLSYVENNLLLFLKYPYQSSAHLSAAVQIQEICDKVGHRLSSKFLTAEKRTEAYVEMFKGDELFQGTDSSATSLKMFFVLLVSLLFPCFAKQMPYQFNK